MNNNPLSEKQRPPAAGQRPAGNSDSNNAISAIDETASKACAVT
jgi:hypothetical protein